MSEASKVVPFVAKPVPLGVNLHPDPAASLKVEMDRALDAIARELGGSLTLYQRIAIEREIEAYAARAVWLARDDCPW